MVIYFDCISFRSPVKDKHHLLWVIALLKRSNKFDFVWASEWAERVLVVFLFPSVNGHHHRKSCHCCVMEWSVPLVILPHAGSWSWGQHDRYANAVLIGSNTVCRSPIWWDESKGCLQDMVMKEVVLRAVKQHTAYLHARIIKVYHQSGGIQRLKAVWNQGIKARQQAKICACVLDMASPLTLSHLYRTCLATFF